MSAKRLRDQLAVQTPRTATCSVFMQLRTMDSNILSHFRSPAIHDSKCFPADSWYYRLHMRKSAIFCVCVTIFSKRKYWWNISDAYDFSKGAKIVESLLFHAFQFVSWRMDSETFRKFEDQVFASNIFGSIYIWPKNVWKATAVDVFIVILSGMSVQHPKVYVSRVFRYILNWH